MAINKKMIVMLLSSVSLLFACNSTNNSNDGDDEKATTAYFKDVAKEVAEGLNEERLFDRFYDKDDNRFYVDFYYDLHFHLSLRIEEYDLYNFTLYPSEGVISSDYESVTFEYTAYEKSELFTRGTYVLKHQVKNNKNVFSLTANDKTYSLTTESKEEPHFIYYDLIGDFEYQEDEEVKFSFTVDVGSKEEKYPVSISLEEGDKHFIGKNIRNSASTTYFDISGDSNGQYLKANDSVCFTYEESNETFKLTTSDNTYSLIKTRGHEKETNLTFFEENAGKIKLACDDFEARLVVTTESSSMVYVIFKELVEDGNPNNFWCWFEADYESDSMTNITNITNKNNKIFKDHDKYMFTHRVVDDLDIVDLYFDGVLTYSNLNILPIE